MERMEHPSPALDALDLPGLVGRSVVDARAEVEAAGGTLRAYHAGQALHADFRPDRLTVRIDGDRVVEVHGFG